MKLPPAVMEALVETCLEAGDCDEISSGTDVIVQKVLGSAVKAGQWVAAHSILQKRPEVLVALGEDVMQKFVESAKAGHWDTARFVLQNGPQVLDALGADIVQELAEFAVGRSDGHPASLMLQKRPERLDAFRRFVERRAGDLAGTPDALLRFATNALAAGVKPSAVSERSIAEHIGRTGEPQDAIRFFESPPRTVDLRRPVLDTILEIRCWRLSYGFKTYLAKVVIGRGDWHRTGQMMAHFEFATVLRTEAKAHLNALDSERRAQFYLDACSNGFAFLLGAEHLQEIEGALPYFRGWEHLNNLLAFARTDGPLIIYKLATASPEFTGRLADVLIGRILPSGAKGPTAERLVSAIVRAGPLWGTDFPFRCSPRTGVPRPSVTLSLPCALCNRTADVFADLDATRRWSRRDLLACMCQAETREGSLGRSVGILKSHAERAYIAEVMFRGAGAIGDLDTLQWLRENHLVNGVKLVAITLTRTWLGEGVTLSQLLDRHIIRPQDLRNFVRAHPSWWRSRPRSPIGSHLWLRLVLVEDPGAIRKILSAGETRLLRTHGFLVRCFQDAAPDSLARQLPPAAQSSRKIPSDFPYWPQVLDEGGLACFNIFSASPSTYGQVKKQLSRYRARQPRCRHGVVIGRYFSSTETIAGLTLMDEDWWPDWRGPDQNSSEVPFESLIELSEIPFKFLFELAEVTLRHELMKRKVQDSVGEGCSDSALTWTDAFKMHCVRCGDKCKCVPSSPMLLSRGETHAGRGEASGDKKESEAAEMGISLQGLEGSLIPVECRLIKHSELLTTLIEDLQREEAQKPIPLEVTGPVLRRALDYCRRYVEEKSRFDYRAFAQDDPGTLSVIITALAYMDFTSVFEIACRALAERVKELSPAQLREVIDVQSDGDWPDDEKQSVDADWAAVRRKLYGEAPPGASWTVAGAEQA
ncbi:hypothetical protein NKR23_g8990 [Pleurostoma richardsiae]|uniref:SKP1 component POZ domain-containing protein n=1 Tax=Pleurostoma richardsiae TaxID=41990 RepID=A0AA38R7X6_9PEZI|nr:hypothetical protein NKR23_g8990 [Pleurostoma richardsiae]